MIRRMKQWLLVGLGNPGSRYEKTRHNVGIRALRFWVSQQAPDAFWRAVSRFEAELAAVGDITVFFPLTNMNDSGRAVAAYTKTNSLTPEQVIIVHDDVELALGEVRWKEGGSAAGHNGVRSVQTAMGVKQILRLRIGIGRPAYAEASAGGTPTLRGYVLQPFSAPEEAQLPAVLTVAAQMLQQRLCPE